MTIRGEKLVSYVRSDGWAGEISIRDGISDLHIDLHQSDNVLYLTRDQAKELVEKLNDYLGVLSDAS